MDLCEMSRFEWAESVYGQGSTFTFTLPLYRFEESEMTG